MRPLTWVCFSSIHRHMKREAVSFGLIVLAAGCHQVPRGEWPPSGTGFQCVNGYTAENARVLADERQRLEIIGGALNAAPLDIDREYEHAAREAGCSVYDLLEADEEIVRRKDVSLEETI